MKETSVTLENKGEKIIGVLHQTDSKTDDIVIIAHGFTGDKDGPDDISIKLARSLAHQGIAALRFDFRGSGESEGDFVDITITGEVSDLKVAIDYAKDEGYSKVGLVGESLGGAVSVLGWDERINCLVLWYPAIYLKETVGLRFEGIESKGYVVFERRDGRVYKAGLNLAKEWTTLDVANKVPNIKCPLLIITGDNDKDVPHNQSERAFKLANEPKKLEIIHGADHCFRGENREEGQTKAIQLTIDWFNKWLK